MRELVERMIDIYVRYLLKIEADGKVKLSLLANVLIGIGFGVAGCMLLWAAEVRLGP